MRYPFIVSNTACSLLALSLLAAPAEARTYKWVDAQGKVHYSDTLPPEAATQGTAEIGKSGSAVKRQESATERKARLAREVEANRQKMLADEAARKDRALLATYTSDKEIDLARDRALEHHRLIIKSTQARMVPVSKQSAQALKKVTDMQNSGKPVPPHLRQELQELSAELDRLRTTITTNEEALIRVAERYEADKRRFRELKGLPPLPTAPSAASPAPVVQDNKPAAIPAKPASKP